MRALLLQSLKRRVSTEIAPQNPLKYLIDIDIDKYIDGFISVVYLYTRAKRGAQKNTIYMTEVISALGHELRNKLKLKKDSALAAKTGGFILYSFEAMGILQVTLGKGARGHNSYIIQVLDDEALCGLWADIPINKTEKLPSILPYSPWTSSKHETGQMMIKTGNKEVLSKVTPETTPMLFDCLNKAQEVGWTIHDIIYEIQGWALRNKTAAFSDIWEQTNPEARTTKLREVTAIDGIAKRFIGKTFYHLYYYDFRGRKYPTTAYLHEQGSDLARGLLRRHDSMPIGLGGYHWLLISIASNWAGESGQVNKTDKIPLTERIAWTLDNEAIILSYAESPKVHQGWMEADKPWQFLAACLELKAFRDWQDMTCTTDDYSYESHLEVYIDGSNNGSQHLTALTRDELTAPHVNLVPLPLPGDLYKYVADHVWARLEATVAEYPKSIVDACERFINNVIDFKKQILAAPHNSDRRVALINEIKQFKDTYHELADLAAPVYWLRVTDTKQRRKIVKRNVMTLPYGGTAYGLGQQQIDDSKKHGIDLLIHMEHKWGAYLGREVFEDCRVSLERPMQLLSVFEAAGKVAEDAGEFLSWTVPITHFPVVQNYTEGNVKKIWVQYGPPMGARMNTGYYLNTLQLAICFIEDHKPSKGKQSQGASPNAIHSLDAAHLTMTTVQADFAVTTIHDSFGCLLGHMPALFKLIRETFVELYDSDPLTSIMKDIKGDISNVQMGTLDINLVKESEYCFV